MVMSDQEDWAQLEPTEPDQAGTEQQVLELRWLLKRMVEWVDDWPFFYVRRGVLEQVPDALVPALRRLRKRLEVTE